MTVFNLGEKYPIKSEAKTLSNVFITRNGSIIRSRHSKTLI